MSDSVREYRGPIVRKYGPDGTFKSSSVVKNLGWLTAHASNVELMRLIWTRTFPNGRHSRDLICVLIADGTLPNGGTFKYGCVFASVEVARGFMRLHSFAHAVREDHTVPVLGNGPYADPQLNDMRTIGEKRAQQLNSGAFCPWPRAQDIGRIYPSPEYLRSRPR